MAKEKAEKTAPKNKLSIKSKLLLFLALAGCIFMFRQSTVLLLIGLLPALVALIVDTTSSRAWAKTVFCFNLAGIMPTMAEIFFTGSGGNLDRIGDMNMWLMAYSAAGAAWLIIWLSPIIAGFWLDIYADYRIERHSAKMAQLDEEWNIGNS